MRADQIPPGEVRQKLEAADPFVLLDVREPWEYQRVHLPGSVLIPLGELPHRLGELDTEDEIVTICHHGIRSMTALAILAQGGFPKVRNMTGGIDAYACLVDPTLPRYS